MSKAIAQLSGDWITPASFSFGWVSYTFGALLSAFGDGIFLPHPDFPAKIITVKNAGSRPNESWIVARLIRDLELATEKRFSDETWRLDTSLMVSVYDSMPDIHRDDEAEKELEKPPKNAPKDIVWWSYLVVCIAQLVVAAWPLYRPNHERNWSILMITGTGILLSLLTGSSWQFKREKFGCRKNSKQDYLLTQGNGHTHAFLIRHREANSTLHPQRTEPSHVGVSLNLEDLAIPGKYRARRYSRALAVVNAVLWIFYLITVGGLTVDIWPLFIVGSIGMVHNIVTASVTRTPAAHGFHMKLKNATTHQNTIIGQHPTDRRSGKPKVMSVLFDLEAAYPGAGIALLPEFFTGKLSQEEDERWQGYRANLRERRSRPEQAQGINRAPSIADPQALTPLQIATILFLLYQQQAQPPPPQVLAPVQAVPQIPLPQQAQPPAPLIPPGTDVDDLVGMNVADLE